MHDMWYCACGEFHLEGEVCPRDWRLSLRRVITSLEFDPVNDDALIVTLKGGRKLRICDAGQQCCEDRYLRTDDYLGDYVGARLFDIVVKHGPEETDDWGGAHDVAFIELFTSKGSLVLAAHNKHNGNYAGFDIAIDVIFNP